MEAYSFYCSRCRRDHAGECEIKVLSRVPSIGSLWVMEMLDSDKKWHRTSVVWEVVGYSEPDYERVRMKQHVSWGGEYTYPAEAWRTQAPRPGDPATYTRMVPA